MDRPPPGPRPRRRRRELGLPEQDDRPIAQVWQRVATFHLVCLGWVFFKVGSDPTASLSTVWTILGRLFTAWGPSPLVTPLLVGAIALGIGMQYIPEGTGERVRVAFSRMGVAAQGATLGLVLFAITTLGPQGVAPFIYFQF